MSVETQWSLPDYKAYDTPPAGQDAVESILAASLRLSVDSIGFEATRAAVTAWLDQAQVPGNTTAVDEQIGL